jgi:hypothetical protein
MVRMYSNDRYRWTDINRRKQPRLPDAQQRRRCHSQQESTRGYTKQTHTFQRQTPPIVCLVAPSAIGYTNKSCEALERGPHQQWYSEQPCPIARLNDSSNGTEDP